MVNGIRASDPHGLNKGHGSKFHVVSWVQQETTEEGQRTYQPKHCKYNNKDEDNSSKTLNDKNHQASSQKFRQLMQKMHKNNGGSICSENVVHQFLNIKNENEWKYF